MPTYGRPAPTEYAAYYHRYLELVPAGDLLATLEDQGVEALSLWGGLGDERAARRYAPGKWSVKEVVGHVIDTERVFALRALWFARGDAGPLPSMNHDAWVPAGAFDARRLDDLAEEYRTQRRATLLLLRGLPDEAPARRGVASGYEITVRTLAWLIAGHERHHLNVLRERYLQK